MLANVLVQSILQSPDVTMQQCSVHMCWSGVLLKHEEVSRHVANRWQHLLHQQDIPVVCTICLYSGFNKEQSVQPSCETAADTMTEDRSGPQQALGTNIMLLC